MPLRGDIMPDPPGTVMLILVPVGIFSFDVNSICERIDYVAPAGTAEASVAPYLYFGKK